MTALTRLDLLEPILHASDILQARDTIRIATGSTAEWTTVLAEHGVKVDAGTDWAIGWLRTVITEDVFEAPDPQAAVLDFLPLLGIKRAGAGHVTAWAAALWDRMWSRRLARLPLPERLPWLRAGLYRKKPELEAAEARTTGDPPRHQRRREYAGYDTEHIDTLAAFALEVWGGPPAVQQYTVDGQDRTRMVATPPRTWAVGHQNRPPILDDDDESNPDSDRTNRDPRLAALAMLRPIRIEDLKPAVPVKRGNLLGHYWTFDGLWSRLRRTTDWWDAHRGSQLDQLAQRAWLSPTEREVVDHVLGWQHHRNACDQLGVLWRGLRRKLQAAARRSEDAQAAFEARGRARYLRLRARPSPMPVCAPVLPAGLAVEVRIGCVAPAYCYPVPLYKPSQYRCLKLSEWIRLPSLKPNIPWPMGPGRRAWSALLASHDQHVYAAPGCPFCRIERELPAVSSWWQEYLDPLWSETPGFARVYQCSRKEFLDVERVPFGANGARATAPRAALDGPCPDRTRRRVTRAGATGVKPHVLHPAPDPERGARHPRGGLTPKVLQFQATSDGVTTQSRQSGTQSPHRDRRVGSRKGPSLGQRTSPAPSRETRIGDGKETRPAGVLSGQALDAGSVSRGS